MGWDAYMGLSVGCLFPLTAKNWPRLRRAFANPRLQTLLQYGGASVLYPSRRSFTARPSTMANGNVASATGAADSVIIGGAAASRAPGVTAWEALGRSRMVNLPPPAAL